MDGLAKICEADLAPVLGVGGITVENVAGVVEAGASGIAVVTAVTRANDMQAATEELLKAFDSAAG